jgi:LuxR family maltose regulon positive regulatory protein
MRGGVDVKQANTGGSEPHYYSERLRQKLNSLRQAPVTIVEAPSGYGKTTAVRDFLKTALPQDTPVFWFTATDEAHSSGYLRLCRELEKIDSYAGQRLLNIGLPNAATVGETCDALRSLDCATETYLVIDNFQFFNSIMPAALFMALLEHGGVGLHIVVITQMLEREIHTAAAGRGFLHFTASDLKLDPEDILNYFTLAQEKITPDDAELVSRYTEGWMIAVYLQLCAYRNTGKFTDTALLSLMERLVWDSWTAQQQAFMMRLSPFETFTIRQACCLSGCDTLSSYARNALRCPFIRYDSAGQKFEMHSILSGLLLQKRDEQEPSFRRECLVSAGDYCRGERQTAEAFGFYAQAGEFDRMLSLDFSHILLEDIGSRRFSEHALSIARTWPDDIKQKHLLSMLRIAWTLLLTGDRKDFDALLAQLRPMLEDSDGGDAPLLLGEWTLLYSYKAFPDLGAMTEIMQKAEKLFGGNCSRVILPSAPWCFGEINPFRAFHAQPGNAGNEADLLEKYLAIYTRLTNGHGSGGDALFRAWFAYSSGDLSAAEIFSYKAAYLAESRKQGVVLLGTSYLLAEIALHKSDADGWQNAVASMERAASFAGQNNYVTGAIADICRGLLFNQLEIPERVSGWLKEGRLTKQYILPGMYEFALQVYAGCLHRSEKYSKLIGTLEAYLSGHSSERPFVEMVYSFLTAVGYFALGDMRNAEALIERAVDIAIPDGLIYPVAAYSWLLGELTDKLIKEKYPRHLESYLDVKDKFASGWELLHTAMLREGLPSGLTEREYEVARLAVEGRRNSEIAEALSVSESTVRTHLRTIFQKLDIDRRAQLADKLK